MNAADNRTPAEIRLDQYAERATFSVATYESGNERALHQIATELRAEVERLRAGWSMREDEVRAYLERSAPRVAGNADAWALGMGVLAILDAPGGGKRPEVTR